MNADYWINYYKTKRDMGPSDFAKYCKKVLPDNLSFVDIGCGDGRDTKYLGADGVDLATTGVDVNEFFKVDKMYGVAYARFFLHAIDRNTGDNLIKWAYRNCMFLALETRSSLDSPDETHSRRLIDGNDLLRDLIDVGFKIQYFEEGYGFSRLNGEDPCLIRLIVKK